MKKVLSLIVFILSIALQLHAQNNPPVAFNDTIYGFAGYHVQVNPLKNDYDPDGDSISLKIITGSWTKVNDSTYDRTIPSSLEFLYIAPILETVYIIQDSFGNESMGSVIIIIKAHSQFELLDINNFSALISSTGNHFWDLNISRSEVPKNSGQKPIFTSTVWIGGKDDSSYIHMAAERYRQYGFDYASGPIASIYDSNFQKKWDKVWKLDKELIRYHIANYNTQGYKAIDAIETWPSYGNAILGIDKELAPFYDHDNDGKYDASKGDYPLLRGDQAIVFIINDDRFMHSESYGFPLNIEIAGMAYAFDRPDDSILNNSIFFHLDITNRSELTYYDTYIALFNDFDIGYALDDYMGTDVSNGMVYGYNADDLDEDTTTTIDYGLHPPAIAMKLIAGPYLTPDGIDNQIGLCDNGVTGFNFGDGIADNERMGMTNSLGFNNTGGSSSLFWDPSNFGEYYNSMQAKWIDGSYLLFGGNGHTLGGALGPECNFIYPGKSDTLCNLGTNGVLPNGGYNQNNFFWDENSNHNTPNDRRAMASVGPFTFAPGQSIPLDYCFIWARDYQGNNLSSLDLLIERTAELKPLLSNLIKIPTTYYGIQDVFGESLISIYPNPASNKVVIQTNHNLMGKINVSVFSVTGKLQINSIFNNQNHIEIDVSKWMKGIYLVKVQTNNIVETKKLVVD